MNLMRALEAIALVGGIGLVVVIFFVVRERMRQQEERQRMADAAFEAEALALVQASTTSGDDIPLGFGSSAPDVSAIWAEAPVAEIPLVFPSSSEVSISSQDQQANEAPYSRQPADATCSGVIRQLQNAGMVEQQEGYVELHGNPRAAISLLMKSGVTCLVVPYHETEVFTQRNLKRYGMLIYVGRDGKGTVLSSLEETIAARVGGRLGF